jgi:hypothetical protein
VRAKVSSGVGARAAEPIYYREKSMVLGTFLLGAFATSSYHLLQPNKCTVGGNHFKERKRKYYLKSSKHLKENVKFNRLINMLILL